MTLSIGGLIKTTGTILVFAGANLFLFEIVWKTTTTVPPAVKLQLRAAPGRIADLLTMPPANPRLPREPVITKPKLLFRTEPQYTREARAARFSGKVHVSFIVDQNGKPRDIKVLNSPGLGLDDNILHAIARWRCQPATREGVPIEMTVTTEVNFRLP